ncbi:MAG: AAA family ATPase [Spirulinaceae cyanobacterium]
MLNSLHISGFRTFKDLKIDRLGRVNLIVGRNNVGKTSLLEAVHIYTSSDVLDPILQLLERRQEYTFEENSKDLSLQKIFHRAIDRMEPIRISESDHETQLSMSRKWQWHEIDKDENSIYPSANIPPDDVDAVEMIRVEKGGRGIRLIPMQDERRHSPHTSLKNSDRNGIFLFLTGFYDKSINTSSLWDRIVLTSNEDSVLDALRVIEPDLDRIVMVQGRHSERLAMARLKKQKPMPLRSLGDGMNRLFELAIGLVSAGEGGTFLVDEIDSGLHFRTLIDVWRLVFATAARLNLQVFATTHSWDCIEAFQSAAAEHPEESLLIRLERIEDQIYAETFSEEELAIVTRQSIEVR